MATDFRSGVEVWDVKNPGTDPKVTDERVSKTKVVIRNSLGQFHGATNFRSR